MSEETVLEVVTTHRYTVRQVTAWEVVHSSTHTKPMFWSTDMGNRVCMCTTEAEANRLAKLLADNQQ